MGIFSKLFGKKGKDESAEQPLEFKQAVDFNTKFSDLLKADTFIARSNYKQLIQEYQFTATFFENSKRAQTLTYYCRQNKVNQEEINKFLASYEDIIDLSKGSNPEKYHVAGAIKLGDYNVGRNEKMLTIPIYMGFLLNEF